jgi:hypothetical protein
MGIDNERGLSRAPMRYARWSGLEKDLVLVLVLGVMGRVVRI